MTHNIVAVPTFLKYTKHFQLQGSTQKQATLANTLEHYRHNYHHIVKQTQRQKAVVTLWSSCLLTSPFVTLWTITVLNASQFQMTMLRHSCVSSSTIDEMSRVHQSAGVWKSSQFFLIIGNNESGGKKIQITELSFKLFVLQERISVPYILRLYIKLQIQSTIKFNQCI